MKMTKTNTAVKYHRGWHRHKDGIEIDTCFEIAKTDTDLKITHRLTQT